MAAPRQFSRTSSVGQKLPTLEPGDHLDQKTFHARYEAMGEHVQAELIGGIVYMHSPLKVTHGRPHSEVIGWLMLYKAATPGTDVLDNTTAILDEHCEPQADASLLILPEFGGQTQENEENYLTGAPEFMGEVASSSVAYDLHSKRQDYEKAGVQEYLVLIVEEKRAIWFVRRDEKFVSMPPDKDGIYRSQIFPGLWLDVDAVFRGDTARVHEVARQGLASPEHAQFVERLKRPTS